MEYSHLDDVPHSIRQQRMLQSPAPSHYSIVTNTPSPLPHNRQVMSPNPLSTPQHPTSATAAAEHQSGGSFVTMRSMTQVELPAEVLRSFTTSISDDLSFAADIQAALIELASRIQYRTEVLGSAVGEVGQSVRGLQDGYSQLAGGLEKIHSDLQYQKNVIQSLVEAKNANRHELDQLKTSLQHHLEERAKEMTAVKVTVENSVQREATLLARMEVLEGQMLQLNENIRQFPSTGHGVARQVEQEGEGETAPPDIAALHERMDGIGRETLRIARQADDFLSRLEQVEGLCEHLTEAWRDDVPVIQMTPEAAAEISIGGNADQEQEDWWTAPASDEAQNPWGLTVPPELPPGLTKAATASLDESVGPSADAFTDIPNGRWKAMLDLPVYKTITGQPWETALAFTTWRRQFVAVCETVSGPFARYVEAQFDAAHRRHELRMAGGTRQDIPAVEERFRDWESRLVVGLLKVLPQDVKSAVVEDPSTTMTSLGLLEEVVTLVQPGGREEVASLLSYIRGLQPATSAKEALEIIRKWRTARARAAALGLPATAPSEAMRSLSSLTRTLERKLDSLRTRLSIMKLAPEIQFPTENGVTMILNTLENELRQASADETVRLNKQQAGSSEEVPTAAKGKGKGKEADKGRGKSKGKGKESKGKQGKTDAGGAGSGSGGKGESSDRRKEMPCHFHWSSAGCYRKSCPYSHAEKHKPKPNAAAAVQAPALVGGGGAEDSSAAQATAKPKPKPKPKPKASSVTTFTSTALMAMRPGGFEREESDSSDASSLSDVSEASLDSEASTVSILTSNPPENNFAEALVGALEHARLEAQESLCYLILDHDEYICWRQPRTINSRAHRQWCEVAIGPDAPPNVAIVIWMVLRHEEFATPLEDIEVSETQRIVRIDRISVACVDGTAREAYLAWCVDVADGNEVFMVVTRGSYHPQVRSYVESTIAPEHTPMQETELSHQHHRQTQTSTSSRSALPYLCEEEPPLGGASSSGGSIAMKACSQRLDEHVLLDTGANEVVRTGGQRPQRAHSAPIQLADGKQIEALRTRDGDIWIEAGPDSSTLVGVCRLVSLGANFTWDQTGAYLQMPDELGGEWIALQVTNGLPFLAYDAFKSLRPLLTKEWKREHCTAATAAVLEDPLVNRIITWSEVAEIAASASHSVKDVVDAAEHRAAVAMNEEELGFQQVGTVIRESNLPSRTQPARRCMQQTHDEPVRSWTLGAWRRGGVTGISTITRERPNLVKLVNRMLRECVPEATWTSITINDGITFMPHRDGQNEASSQNLVICLDGPRAGRGGALWIEDPQGTVHRQIKPGVQLAGRLHTLRHKALLFDPSKWHGTEPWSGRRLVVTAYTAGLWEKLSEQDKTSLRELNFPLPRPKQAAASVEVEAQPQQSFTLTSMPQIKDHPNTVTPETDSIIQGVQGGCGESEVEGHSEFWRDVCEARKDSEGAQALQFRDESESSARECHEDPSTAYAIHTTYQKGCLECQASRGHRKAHYRIPTHQVSSGVVSFDLSGPHVLGKDQSLYFLVGAFTTSDKRTLPYIRTQTSKKSAETLQHMKSILMQLRAELEDPAAVIRVHSDNGGEFVAGRVVEALHSDAIWKTCTAAYEPESNGRAERQVQAIKEKATSFLLHADLPRSFWPYAVRQAAYELRLLAMDKEIPAGTPRFGDQVGVRIQGAEAFGPRVREGIFLCIEEAMQDASQVLVDTEAGVRFMTTRLPTPLAGENKRWRKVVSPDETLAVWVSQDGSTRWTPPNADELITLEERLQGPEAEDHELRVAARIRSVLKAEEGSEMNAFSCPANTITSVAAAAASAQGAKKKASYGIWSLQAEKEAYKDEARALAAMSGQDATEADDTSLHFDTRVFTEGPDWRKQKWLNGLETELTTMFEDKRALIKTKKSELRAYLGLSPDDPLPKTLPSKLVVNAKPDGIPGPDGKTPPVDLNDGDTFRAKVRLVACGNFDWDVRRGDPKFKSSNVPPEAIRAIISLVAQNPSWVCALMDIVTAFLNADLDDSEVILLQPPPIMRKLAKAADDEIWIVKKAVYGLRAAPKAWERARDQKLNNAILTAEAGHELGDLRLVPWDITAGLWRIVQTSKPDVILGVLAMYVDDGLLAGAPEVVQRVGAFILNAWNTKLQAVLANAEMSLHAGNTFAIANKPVPIVQEATFLGIQIRRMSDGALFLTQEAWVKAELKSRGWDTFNGTKSLPVVNEGHYQQQIKDDLHASQLKDAQSQVGALLWIALRTRPDLAASVGVTATLMSHCPGEALKIAKGLWRYVSYTRNFGIRYTPGDAGSTLKTSSDASWAPGGSRSRTGITVHWGTHLIAWRSQRQTLTAYSPAEAELDALGSSLQLGCKIQNMIESIVGRKLEHHLQGDNMASIQQLLDPGYFVDDQRTRHFALRCAYVRDHLSASDTCLDHCPGLELPADALTKILASTKLQLARNMLGMCDASGA